MRGGTSLDPLLDNELQLEPAGTGDSGREAPYLYYAHLYNPVWT